jgi:hypothetical protein
VGRLDRRDAGTEHTDLAWKVGPDVGDRVDRDATVDPLHAAGPGEQPLGGLDGPDHHEDVHLVSL